MPKPDVMVVDDDDDGREYVHHVLSALGHEVTSFKSGDAALGAVAKGYSPGIAIVDVSMPGTDGLEVLQRLKGMCASTVVMMLSAGSDPDTIVAAGRFGAARYLTKPILAATLQAALAEAVEAHRVAQSVAALEEAL